jgi:hypothetical protein
MVSASEASRTRGPLDDDAAGERTRCIGIRLAGMVGRSAASTAGAADPCTIGAGASVTVGTVGTVGAAGRPVEGDAPGPVRMGERAMGFALRATATGMLGSVRAY